VALDVMLMEQAFSRLGEMALAAGRVVDMAVYGGSALAVAYDLRSTTKDVDAVFEQDKDFVRKAVELVAEEMDLPSDWLNDAVKGYVSPKESGNMIMFGSFPSEARAGLRIFVPAPEYFFAMKCIDIRTGASSKDVEDVKNLALVCKIKNANEALDIVEGFYPDRLIPAKARFALEEIFQSLDVEKNIDHGRSGFRQLLDKHKKAKDSANTVETRPGVTKREP
jgi:hypothetical protein